MNPKSLILLIILYLTPTLSLDPKFEACEPKTCGHGPNISYPFYIRGRQKAFCGNPGFDLTCGTHGYPILNLINTNYTVDKIFYNNHSLRLSNPAFSSHAGSCLARARNVTAGKYRFLVAPAQRRVMVVYGCAGVQVGTRIGCDAGNETASVLALEGGREELEMARGNCTGGLAEAVVEDVGGGGGVAAALRRGFLLIWNATNCTECVNSGGRCGFDLSTDIYAFRCYCPDRPHTVKCGTGTNGLSKIGKIGIGLSVGLLCILVIGWLLHHKRKHSSSGDQFQTKSTYSNPSSDPAVEGGSAYCGVHLFSYKELEEATNSFDLNKQIGDGGFGTVYYGKLKDGREVAVKHLYDHNYRRVEQFMNEVQILTRLRHRNLVSLYGCTSSQSRELLLVYEYIPNGTVASHLRGELSKPSLLTWPIRIKIAVETATALAYLHASNIIHRDVKTTNILLDNSFCVKVADFGLSRLFPNDITHVSTAPQGTPGYVDPEYHQCYHLTSKSDVYSFGVVLVELISSMQAVDVNRPKDEINLSNLAIKKIQKGALSELVDPFLGFDSENHEVKRMIVEVAGLAFQCLQVDRELRPSMDEVLEALKRIERGKDETKHLEAADDVHDSEVSHSDVTEFDEAGLLKNRKPPSSPISVTESWESKSTTPNVSS